MNGYIKLSRKLLSWRWFNKDYMLRVWMYLLLNASFDLVEIGNAKIGKGQVLVGRKQMAKDLNLSEQQVRTALQRLKSTNEITIESTNQYSIITVVNWEFYQDSTQKSTNKSTDIAPNEQPTDNQRITTYKEGKEGKEGKETIIRHKYGTYGHVRLSDKELQKLHDDYGEDLISEYIQKLDEGIQLKGYKYKDYNLALRNWIKRDHAKREDLPVYDASENPVFDEKRFEELMRRRA